MTEADRGQTQIKPERVSPLNEPFFYIPEGTSRGIQYEPYTQLEEIGFSCDSVANARAERVLDGKVLVVVGARLGGIGEAAILEAAAQGASVVGSSRQNADAEGPTKMMGAASELSGNDCLWVPADITDENASGKILDATLKKYGKIDGIVLAAAQVEDKQFTDYDRKDLRKLFDVNLFGNLFLLQDSLKVFEQQKQGRAVFVSSVSGAKTAGQPGYGAAKAAMENIIRSVPLEYIRYRGAIAANSIVSGHSETDLSSVLKDSQIDRAHKFTKAERSLLPQEVAEPIIYLFGPDATVNGKSIPIVGRGEMPSIDERNLISR